LFVCGWSQSGALGLGDGVSKVQVPTEVPTEEPVASVVCGKKFTIFATVSGKVFAMGDNTHSELGSSAAGKVSTVPVPVEGLEGVKIVEVSAGANHALALSHQGEVFSWGWGGSSVPGSSVGALGHGDVQTQPRPKKILALEGVKVTQLASGAKHSIVLDAQGNVYTWGFGEQGVFLLDLSYFTSCVCASVYVYVCVCMYAYTHTHTHTTHTHAHYICKHREAGSWQQQGSANACQNRKHSAHGAGAMRRPLFWLRRQVNEQINKNMQRIILFYLCICFFLFVYLSTQPEKFFKIFFIRALFIVIFLDFFLNYLSTKPETRSPQRTSAVGGVLIFYFLNTKKA
jgi:alpha-tubulin suppressor-like RCC1 family protein